MARAWVHENRRVFGDRLINADDRVQFNRLLQGQLLKHTDITWKATFSGPRGAAPEPVEEGEEGADDDAAVAAAAAAATAEAATENGGGTEGGDGDDGDAEVDESVFICDFLVPGADPKIYEEVADPAELQPLVEEYLAEYNSESKQVMHGRVVMMYSCSCTFVRMFVASHHDHARTTECTPMHNQYESQL